MSDTIHSVIGWAGAFLYILAYLLLSIRKLRADQTAYQVLNITGGIFLVINSLRTGDYPSVVTNVIWAAIGLFAIYYNWPGRNR